MAKDDDSKQKSHGLGFLGLIVGAIGGAIGGLLFAPKPGKELRDDIKKLYSDVHSEVLERSLEVRDLTQKKYDEIVAEVVDKYGPVLEKKKSLEEWIEELKKEWPKVLEKIQNKQNPAKSSKKK